MISETLALAPVPAHVPEELVRHFSHRVKKVIAPDTDPIVAVYGVLDAEDYPEIFWTPYHGGYWVMRRFADVREAMRSDAWSTFPASIPANPNRPWKLNPIELDPPEHDKYRAILSPLFTPRAVKALEGRVREVTVEVIESFLGKGECDFVREFSHRMPTRILLGLIGYPCDDVSLDRFLPWVDQVFRGTPEERLSGGVEILRFVEDFVDERTANPVDDLISMMIHKVTLPSEGDRRMTRQEVIDMGFQLFVASLDTVPATFVSAFRFLANNPEAQRFLVENPDEILEVAEEMLRITGVVSPSRTATRDMVVKGVTIKAGEKVLLPLSLANRDSAVFSSPTELVLDREVNQHLTFGAGPHRCLGSHFARTEVQIVLEEWSKRIPSFRIKPGAELVLDAAGSISLHNLPLEWEVAK